MFKYVFKSPPPLNSISLPLRLLVGPKKCLCWVTCVSVVHLHHVAICIALFSCLIYVLLNQRLIIFWKLFLRLCVDILSHLFFSNNILFVYTLPSPLTCLEIDILSRPRTHTHIQFNVPHVTRGGERARFVCEPAQDGVVER